MRLVIVTGMSGAGKSTALKFLEDSGYYCVDNLPVPLIGKFTELLALPDSEVEKAALGVDVRAAHTFDELLVNLEELKEHNVSYSILFLEAGDDGVHADMGVSVLLRDAMGQGALPRPRNAREDDVPWMHVLSPSG